MATGNAFSSVDENHAHSRWGGDGHPIVGKLVYHCLTPEARQGFARILEGKRMSTVSSWADVVRSQRGEHGDHYLNVPRTAHEVDLSRDANGGKNVVSAIQNNAQPLLDPQATPTLRKEALQYLIHYVGDVHQPLHISFADDKGGNSIKVKAFGESSNLHAVW
ncbi:MAG: S1/P1 nuclease, partial [Planctomycetes bacterium]|nr:S1/P1 nuclease [Planctomycetota bacterium]